MHEFWSCRGNVNCECCSVSNIWTFHEYSLIQNMWLFVEICDEGSLYDYVRNVDNPLTKKLQQQWAMEIAKGMFML